MRKIIPAAALMVAVSLLTLWSPPGAASLRCCYTGEVVDVNAREVEMKLEDGKTATFGELFPEFTSSDTFFPLYYPVFKLDIARVVYSHLAVKFILYDANNNGRIEEPELNVLYMEEAARGLDKPVEHLGGDKRLRAIFIPPGDIDGLIRMVKARRSEMTPDARQTFEEMELLRVDFRLDGTVPGEQGDGPWSP